MKSVENIKNQVKTQSAADMKDKVEIFKHLYPHGVKTLRLVPQEESVDAVSHQTRESK